ncbi:MAG TPA: head GIN domain-containing protein [Flavobacterium sp.]|jgi:hypothetical protein
MRKLIVILLSFAVASCGLSEDCIRSSGTTTLKEFEVSPFENIYVYPGISLVVTQGDQYIVSVEAGENFLDEVKVTVSGNSLTVKDESGCNWVREYGQVTVYVTAPNLVEIYSNTEGTIRSNGTLTYPILRLYSMDFFGGVGTGDFVMNVNNQQLVVQSSNVSAFSITGATDQLLLSFYNGNGRFEGGDFLADEVVVFHRGANDMIVHPVNALRGDIYSTGDLISKTHPPIVEVIEHYSGDLIFE